MASSGTPSPSESVAVDGVTQEGDAPGLVWAVPTGPRVLGRVRELMEDSTSSRAVTPISPGSLVLVKGLPVSREPVQAPTVSAVRATVREDDRFRCGVMPSSPWGGDRG